LRGLTHQLTDGGPSLAPELRGGIAGPPFGGAPAFRYFPLTLCGNTSQTLWGQEDITALENAETLLCFSE